MHHGSTGQVRECLLRSDCLFSHTTANVDEYTRFLVVSGICAGILPDVEGVYLITSAFGEASQEVVKGFL